MFPRMEWGSGTGPLVALAVQLDIAVAILGVKAQGI